MANRYEVLESALTKLAEGSQGRVSFSIRSAPEIGESLGITLARSGTKLYDFEVKPPTGAAFRCVVYRNVVTGADRPLTARVA